MKRRVLRINSISSYIAILALVILNITILHVVRVSPTSHATGTIPTFTHIFQITLENTSYSHIIGSSSASYINSLTAKGGLATQFYGFTHASLPNYFAVTAGQTPMTNYVLNDCGSASADCPQNFISLPEEIKSSGRTWKGYFQSMPSNCDLYRAWPYTEHLNPFVYYSRLINSGDCAKNVVPDTQFYSDLANHTLPNYIWLAPDLCNDGHLSTSSSTCPNGGPYTNYPQAVGQADAWLASVMPKILNSPEYQQNGLIILTWDEGDLTPTQDNSGCCSGANGGHIVTILLSPSIAPGTQRSVPESAYSILRTIESSWSLPTMANEGGFSPMSEFFSTVQPPPTPTANPHPTQLPPTSNSNVSPPAAQTDTLTRSATQTAPTATTTNKTVVAYPNDALSPTATFLKQPIVIILSAFFFLGLILIGVLLLKPTIMQRQLNKNRH